MYAVLPLHPPARACETCQATRGQEPQEEGAGDHPPGILTVEDQTHGPLV